MSCLNTAGAEITGYSPETVAGTSIYSIFGDIGRAIGLSLSAARRGEQTPRFETDIRTPEGFAVRIGYGMAHSDIIGKMLKVKLPFEPGTPAGAAGLQTRNAPEGPRPRRKDQS